MSAVDIFRAAHIAAGIVALTVFWLPLITRKGGTFHRRAGWAYALAMWVAAVSAWVVCVFRLSDNNTSNDSAAVFLFFVGLLAANAAGIGIRVLRTKGRTTRHKNFFDLGASIVLLLGSIGLFGYGVLQQSPLFIAFAALGIFLSAGQLRFWLRPPASKMEWWYEHMRNMLTACIATVTAFLVVNVPRFGLQKYALFFWLTPGIVGGIGIGVWKRYYQRKFQPRN